MEKITLIQLLSIIDVPNVELYEINREEQTRSLIGLVDCLALKKYANYVVIYVEPYIKNEQNIGDQKALFESKIKVNIVKPKR